MNKVLIFFLRNDTQFPVFRFFEVEVENQFYLGLGPDPILGRGQFQLMVKVRAICGRIHYIDIGIPVYRIYGHQ